MKKNTALKSNIFIRRNIYRCNQLQKINVETLMKKRPFLLKIAPGHRAVRYNTDLPPPSH